MAEKPLDAGEIRIEDPLDFLSPSEKKAYLRAHRDWYEEADSTPKHQSDARPGGLFFLEEDEEESYDDDDYEEEEEDVIEEEVEEDWERMGRNNRYREERRYAEEERSAYSRRSGRREDDGYAPRSRAAASAKGNRRRSPVDPGAEVVENTVLDFFLSMMVKAMFAAILVIALIMLYIVYVRPLIRGASGFTDTVADAQAAEDTIGLGLLPNTNGAQQEMSATGGSGESSMRPVPSQPEGEAVKTTTQLNLRTAPSTTDSEVVKTVPEGERLIRLSNDGEWSKVYFNGQELFCASQYLQAAE